MIKYFTIEDLLKHYLQKKFHILEIMKKLLIMMCVLFIINLVAIIIPLWSSENTMIILYRMAIFCNLAVFVPSITLIYREKGKTQ